MSLPTVPADPAAGRIYNRTFWLAYAANLTLVTANALTFRFAEFVKYLGGTEAVTGQVVAVGLVGSLAARLVLGQAMDGLGVRRIWTISSVVFVIGCGLFLAIDRLGGLIYAARALFTIGLASMFACSILHIQNQVPPQRRTEVIGSLGSSGFVGMITGTQLGDLIFHYISDGRSLFLVLFGLTAALGAAYLGIVLYLTRRDRFVRPLRAPPVHRLIFRYWPGPVVLVALMMGLGFAVTTVFLTRYATEMGLGGIRSFFTGYAISAFVMRWVSRTWSQSIGRHRMILMGLAGHAAAHLLLIRVGSEWDLVLPSLFGGFGHALLFPCVVSLGAGAFPEQYRGTGTTITLGFVDLGTVISAPLLGGIIDDYGFPAMFYASAAVTLAIAAAYAVMRFRTVDEETLDDLAARATVPAIDAAAAPRQAKAVGGMAVCAETVQARSP